MAILAQFVVVAFVANVVIRDWETGFGQILHATRISKFDYLFGRFTGAFAASAIVLLSVPLAMALGSTMPWLDHERLGPFVPWHYAYAYLVGGLPTLFLCASLFFALATATRSMMASYIGLVAYLMIYFILSSVFARPEYERMSALLEPYGLGALFEQTKYWTAADRNTLLPPIGPAYLENRAIWLAISTLALAAAYSAFTANSPVTATGQASGQESALHLLPMHGVAVLRWNTDKHYLKWDDLSAYEHLEFFGRLFGLSGAGLMPQRMDLKLKLSTGS